MRKLLSPAKLNLGLRISGRRQDGYHLLESLFWPITLHDEISLEEGNPAGIRVDWNPSAPKKGDAIPSGTDNILNRILVAHPEWKPEIRLSKRIPMGAGLGGGSSNAGTLLKYLEDKLSLGAEAVEAEAARLGADVPYFLNPTPAWVTGIGEKRVPLKVDPSLRDLAFLLVLPPFGCETKTVFKLYKESARPFSTPQNFALPPTIGKADLLRLAGGGTNDLLDAALQIRPEIRKIVDRLHQTVPLLCGMSGSGSTCYAVYENLKGLEKSTQGLSGFFRSTQCATTTVRTHGVIHS